MSEFEKLLSEYPDEITDLAAEVCKLIYKNATGVKYRVQFGWKVVIYEYEKGFCAVAPHKNWVNLQFYAGKDLPDPLNLLERTGKSMRHVKIQAPDDLGRGVNSLVKAAAKLAHVKSRWELKFDTHNTTLKSDNWARSRTWRTPRTASAYKFSCSNSLYVEFGCKMKGHSRHAPLP